MGWGLKLKNILADLWIWLWKNCSNTKKCSNTQNGSHMYTSVQNAKSPPWATLSHKDKASLAVGVTHYPLCPPVQITPGPSPTRASSHLVRWPVGQAIKTLTCWTKQQLQGYTLIKPGGDIALHSFTGQGDSLTDLTSILCSQASLFSMQYSKSHQPFLKKFIQDKNNAKSPPCSC